MANQSSGSVNISGTDSYFSLAIVFTRLLEFKVKDKKFQSYSYLNVTEACNQTDPLYNSKFHDVDLSSEDLEWTMTGDSLIARDQRSNNLFTINVSLKDWTIILIISWSINGCL